jgi:hypothetical protein
MAAMAVEVVEVSTAVVVAGHTVEGAEVFTEVVDLILVAAEGGIVAAAPMAAHGLSEEEAPIAAAGFAADPRRVVTAQAGVRTAGSARRAA